MKKLVKKRKKNKLKNLTEQLQTFTSNLESFSKQYKDNIKFNPTLKEQFYTMCVEIGEDPLTSLSLWNKELNLTEFNNNFNNKRSLIEKNQLRNKLKSNMKVE